MITTILIIINTLIFLTLSALHFYWALGGTWGIDYAVPKQYMESYFAKRTQTKIATYIVAMGLLAFALVTYSNEMEIFSFLKSNVIIILTRIICGIFIVRAIGDFNVFGLFKKTSQSKFAVKDSQIYIPLCLYLGVSSLLITML